MSIKTFSELIEIPTFEERFEYLKLGGFVGEETFGFDRYLNQNFYRSYEWRQLRNQIIIRDNGCDLACEDRDIFGKVIIHHMNPITTDDLIHNSDFLMNPEYLICTTKQTHDAIHYGDLNSLMSIPKERHPNDTIPWR